MRDDAAQDDGTVVVHLGDGHPGFKDPVYRERRNEIATAATRWSRGEPVPRIAYSDEIRPLDFAEMGTIEYDVTKYQPVLYPAESMDHLVDAVGGFFATADDDTPARLAPAHH